MNIVKSVFGKLKNKVELESQKFEFAGRDISQIDADVDKILSNFTKARYTAPEGEQIVTCYTHNMSDFITAANKYNFSLMDLEEWFDNNDRSQIPRILTLLFKKH